jgi:hypothetical protein
MGKRNRDHDNEHSWILLLCGFAGGALNFDDGTKVEGKREWHKINGQTHHWYGLHEGSKYSIVLYRGTRKQNARTIASAVRATCERKACI